MCLLLFVPFGDNQNRMDWRLLSKERIGKITKLITNYFGKFSLRFFGFNI